MKTMKIIIETDGYKTSCTIKEGKKTLGADTLTPKKQAEVVSILYNFAKLFSKNLTPEDSN